LSTNTEGKDKIQKKHKRGQNNGCFYLRNDGRWVARIQIGKKANGKPNIKEFYGKTITEVRTKLKEYQATYARTLNDIVNDTTSAYIIRWLEMYKSKSVRPQTYDNMERIIYNHIVPAFGMIQLKTLNTDMIQKFFNDFVSSTHKGKKYAYSTIGKRKYKMVEGDTKTFNSIRTIPLNKKAMLALENIRAITNPVDDNSLIFATRGGKPANRNNLLRLVRDVAVASGLSDKKLNIHSLRHTIASLLVRKGVDIKVVADLVGHADIKKTYNTYVHIIESQKVNALDLIDEL